MHPEPGHDGVISYGAVVFKLIYQQNGISVNDAGTHEVPGLLCQRQLVLQLGKPASDLTPKTLSISS